VDQLRGGSALTEYRFTTGRTVLVRGDTLKLVLTMNWALGDQGISEERLKKALLHLVANPREPTLENRGPATKGTSSPSRPDCRVEQGVRQPDHAHRLPSPVPQRKRQPDPPPHSALNQHRISSHLFCRSQVCKLVQVTEMPAISSRRAPAGFLGESNEHTHSHCISAVHLSAHN
jgi:hypothetical protein